MAPRVRGTVNDTPAAERSLAKDCDVQCSDNMQIRILNHKQCAATAANLAFP